MLVVFLLLAAIIPDTWAQYTLCSVKRVSAGATHTCALDNNMYMVCFGEKGDGREGPGSSSEADKFIDVANTRALSCFGYESGLDNRLSVPPAPDWPRMSKGGFQWKMSSLGEASTCAIMLEARYRYRDDRPPNNWDISYLELHPTWMPPNQTLLCWGAKTQGQLLFPVYQYWVTMSSGPFHACGIRDDQSLWCWGENWNGQVNPKSSVSIMQPFAVAGKWIDVAAGGSHTCGINTNNDTLCWGDNRYGQATPPCDIKWLQICAGGRHSCGIASTYQIFCWGDNESGQIQADPSIRDWVQVTCGLAHTCAIRANNELRCWGANQHGQATPPDGFVVSACYG